MGKKNKMISQDPILKRNFKFQKRKKQRELQKQKIKQEEQIQEQKLKQIRKIQKQVQQNIQKIYQQEKQKIIHQYSKTKTITKSNLINAFKDKSQKDKLKQNQQIIKKQEILYKNLDKYQFKLKDETEERSQSAFEYHFQANLASVIQTNLIKEKVQSASKKLEKEIKKQIQSMFQVKKLEQIQNQQNDKPIKTTEQMVEQEFMVDEQQNKPFVLNRQLKKQRQIMIDNHLFSISGLVELNPNLLEKVHSNSNQSLVKDRKKISEDLETIEEIVNNYVDYVHVQNNQEQTIESFREIVIRHMYKNQLSCFEALSRQQKAKGFTNAKYLILTPYIGDARAIFDIIESTFIPENQSIKNWMIENKQKIEQEADDQNDFFRVGVKILAKKRKIVYFSNFDSSDIIVASPIGLKSIISGSGNEKKQNSFLSSVQVVYVDRASVIMMQNWQHLIDIFANMNYMPQYESLKNSINEIRSEYLQLKGKIYRQNIVFSEFNFPELNALKVNHFNNWQGTITSKHIFPKLLLENNQSLQKQFFKIQLQQPKQDLETRFQYFKRKFWDKIHNDEHSKKIVIFVNSYFQYVKLKSFLEKVNASAQGICEHTRKQKIQSKVSRFNNNQFKILLLTQRAYYFGLCQIKKFKHIYFYSLPKNPFIYKDLIESMSKDEDQQNKIMCMYSKYDKYLVQRLVGSIKAIQMVKEYCSNVSFIV